MKKKGRPIASEGPCKRIINRQSKKKLEFIDKNPDVKDNVIKVLTKQENWGISEMSEDEAVKLITDIEISDRKAIELMRHLKRSVGIVILTSWKYEISLIQKVILKNKP